MISNYFDIAIKYSLDGFYIPSFNKEFYLKKSLFEKNFLIVGSAHNIKEIRIKERQNVKLIFLSPLFKTEKNNHYLDIIKFNILSKKSKKKIIALGGINKKNINNLKITNAYGFSGISYFLNEK